MDITYSGIICFSLGLGLIFIYSAYYIIFKKKEFDLINILLIFMYLINNTLQMVPTLLYNFETQMFYSNIDIDRIKLFYSRLLFSAVPIVVYFFRESLVSEVGKSIFIQKSHISDGSIRKFIISICFGMFVFEMLIYFFYYLSYIT